MKRTVSMILTAMMVLTLLPGCGSKAADQGTKAAGTGAQTETKSTEPETSDGTPAPAPSSMDKLDEDVTIYVMVKAGGGLDVRARAIAPYLAERLGVNVTVENVEGGGGAICATQFVNQRKGAHDIFMCAASVFTSTTLTTEVAYSLEDVTPLGSIDNEQFGLFVCPNQSGFRTIEDVIAYGRDNVIIFGSGGVGNVTFGMQNALYKALNLEAETLTHSNAPEGLTNCMGGHNVITMAGLEVARSYVESGDVAPVLTFSDGEYAGYEGYTVPGITSLEGCEDLAYSGLQFMCVGSSLPEEDVAFMQQALADCLNDPDCLADLAAIGVASPWIMEPADIVDHIEKEREMLSEIM